MKKILCSIATILPTLFAFSCAKPPSRLNDEDILISDKVVSSVYQKTIADFEDYLLRKYGNDENIEYDYYDFLVTTESQSQLSRFLAIFTYFFDSNKIKALKEIDYRNDDINLYIINSEEGSWCKTLENVVCDTENTIDIDKNINKIGNIDFGNILIQINSKDSQIYKYNKDLIFPVKNYYIEKKELNFLWFHHNSISDAKIEWVSWKGNSFTFLDFRSLNPHPIADGTLNSTLEFITNIEDIFGDLFWEMKASKSFVYTKLVDRFLPIVSLDNKRYDTSNFYKTRPEKNYCKVKNSEAATDDKHYCGQLEQIKLKSSELVPDDIGTEIEISFDVFINETYSSILTEPLTKFKLYFGMLTYVTEDYFIYTYE